MLYGIIEMGRYFKTNEIFEKFIDDVEIHKVIEKCGFKFIKCGIPKRKEFIRTLDNIELFVDMHYEHLSSEEHWYALYRILKMKEQLRRRA